MSRCKYFEAGVHIKNPITYNPITTPTLDHIVGPSIIY
jgi:hypothetical protein